MNKTVLSIIIAGLVIGLAIIFTFGGNNTGNITSDSGKNIEIIDGVQYVTVTARGGYSPRNSVVQSGIPTKLIMKTENTYDCSLALVIRSIGFQKMLESSGEEIIDLGILESGSTLQGTCSMGMYSFAIKAE